MIKTKWQIITHTVTLKEHCRFTWNSAPMRVIQDGPAPRATLIIRLAAVSAAPLVSGGLTLIKHGRTLTLGKDAINPPMKAWKNTQKGGNCHEPRQIGPVLE